MARTGLYWALSLIAVAAAFPLDSTNNPVPVEVSATAIVDGFSQSTVSGATENLPFKPVIVPDTTPVPPLPASSDSAATETASSGATSDAASTPGPVTEQLAELSSVAPVSESSSPEAESTTAASSEPATETTVHHNVRKVAAKETSEGLRICTWNVFRFGPSKYKKPDEFVARYGKDKKTMMVEQICECDILALQEYFDPSLEVLNELIEALKACGSWNYTVSNRVGRTSKEQYAFLFRIEVAKAGASSEAPDPEDVYSRDPFFTNFKILKPGVSLKNITLGTIHTEPAKAVEEMNGLVDTYPWAEKTFGSPDVLVLGDYNGDCQYVRKSEWPNVKLYTDTNFKWFIPNGVDTASMNSECTFDRAVAKSAGFKKSYVEGSMKVQDFVTQYGIKVAEARQLSDHFPVRLLFK